MALDCFRKDENSIETVGDRGDNVGDVRIAALLEEILLSILGQSLSVARCLVVHLNICLRREGLVWETLNWARVDLVLMGDIVLHVSP